MDKKVLIAGLRSAEIIGMFTGMLLKGFLAGDIIAESRLCANAQGFIIEDFSDFIRYRYKNEIEKDDVNEVQDD